MQDFLTASTYGAGCTFCWKLGQCHCQWAMGDDSDSWYFWRLTHMHVSPFFTIKTRWHHTQKIECYPPCVFFKAINLVSQCAPRLHQEVNCCRSSTRKLIWGPSDKTTDVRAAKKRRQSQGTRDGGWNFPGFSPLSKLMHRICGTPVVKRAHYGNLMLLVFSSHPAGILWLFLGRGCKVGGRPVARLWGRETPL